MITVTKQSNSVLFEFENNSHYLQQGSIDIPFNSLILVEDESDMLSFKRAATNDPLFSAMYTEFSSLGNTKDAVVSALEDMLFAEGGGGSGSGVTPSEVEAIVERELTPYWTSGQTEQAIYGATSGLASYSSVTLEVRGATSGLAASSAVTQEINAAVSGKQDISAMTQYWTSAQTESAISQSVSGKQDTLTAGDGIDITSNVISVTGGSITIDPTLSSASTNAVANSAITAALATKMDDDRLIVLTQAEYDALSGQTDPDALYVISDDNVLEAYYTSAQTNAAIAAAVSGKSDTSAVTQSLSSKQDTLVSGTNIKTINNQSLLGSGNITISGGGGNSNVVEVTQAEYDALVSGGTVDPDTLYIISDASEINLSGYAMSSAVTAEITAAVSGKQDTLIAGTNISIDTGNTISCTLPITRGIGQDSIVIGEEIGNSTSGIGAMAQGWGTTAVGGGSFASGYRTNTSHNYEAAFGYFNQSNSGETIGERTLFSIGNGDSGNTHNAFEVKRSGDIYISSGGTDIKLQDYLGGQSLTYYTEDTTNETATIDVQTDDGFGNRSENSVYVDGSSILIESTNDTNDGEGNTANTDTQIVINALGFSVIADYDDGTDFIETQLDVQPMGVYINSDQIVTESSLDGLKLKQVTQAQYDALVSGGTVDSSTLYIITNVVS